MGQLPSRRPTRRRLRARHRARLLVGGGTGTALGSAHSAAAQEARLQAACCVHPALSSVLPCPCAGTPANAPASEAEYEAAVVAWLRQQPNKSAPLAKLGTAIPRPSGLPKLSPWIKSKAGLLESDANNQVVKLVK